MLEYARLDFCLNIRWFLGLAAYQKTIRHFNDQNSGQQTMKVIIAIVVRTILKHQLCTFPIVLAIVLPSQLLSFNIQCPLKFAEVFYALNSHGNALGRFIYHTTPCIMGQVVKLPPFCNPKST